MGGKVTIGKNMRETHIPKSVSEIVKNCSAFGSHRWHGPWDANVTISVGQEAHALIPKIVPGILIY